MRLICRELYIIVIKLELHIKQLNMKYDARVTIMIYVAIDMICI